ncbi:MAG: hypothetical protein QM813_11125 [Verrucomicrobiota bacterium]
MKKTTKKTSAPKTTSTTTATSAPQVADSAKAPLAPVVASPAPVKAMPVVAAAPTPAPAKPAPVKSAAATSDVPVTIEAKIDVGYGNNLFVRGQGGGLSWDRGLPLQNVDFKTWRLIVSAKDKVQFKFLLNDAVWCKGEDLVAVPGKKVEVTPAF